MSNSLRDKRIRSETQISEQLDERYLLSIFIQSELCLCNLLLTTVILK